MGSENRLIARYETTAVYTHPEAKVDIVLVHGLNGSPDKTWTAKNGTFWPLDLLPNALKGTHANIMVYGYNADVYSKKTDRTASDNFIHQHAQSLVTNLTFYRKSEATFKNPIIWVCHSLGGILVKRALLYSADVGEPHLEDFRSIYVSTFGLVFLGTPHTGSDAATWGLILQAMSDAVVPKRLFNSESVLLKTLKRENETLANINSHFLDIYQRFEIHMVHENQKTDIKGSKIIIVDSNSAGPQLPGVTYYGIEATHSGMCKFDSMSSPGFRNISITIQQWIQRAPSGIQERWLAEGDERRARAMKRANEIMSPFASQSGAHSQPPAENYTTASTRREEPVPHKSTSAQPSISEPIFVHPERFRPNSLFRGRQQELDDLHSMLMDSERRDQGTSAVLIWSIPGGGKTHLAREYAFKYRHDYYSGGVFWVRTKAPEDLEDGFLRIAKHAISRAEIEIQDETTLQDPSKVIPLVREWLNRSENWLLILDGALHDTPGLQECIPDARSSSMILTSTDTSIAGNYHFDNPQKLELGPLADDDAQTLLLEEMDRKRPWTQEDLDRAREVVQLVEGLPLAIHAAAGQMRATKEPLSKYIRSYRKRPRAGGLGAYKAVREKLQERGETAALNLVYLLSFFGGRVPVEMLALGLKALDKRTPVRTRDSMGKRSLNKTFTVLIAFALIERDEIEDAPSASTPDETMPVARRVEPLDVLKIHGIVQSFFLEALKKEGQFDFWLERAAAVFLRSFDQGDRRARDNKEMGLPDDYRRYAAHCRKLLKHIKGADKPSHELSMVEETLQERFADIQSRISTLARAMTTDSEGRWVQGPYVSVFDKSNSASLSSSFSIVDHDTLQEEQGSWDLRTSFPSLEINAYAPYPSKNTIPGPEYLEHGDAEKINMESPQLLHAEGHQLRGASQYPIEENPFMGNSLGASPVPSMDVADTHWTRQDRISLRPRASHSETSLDDDIEQWATGLPITSHSVSSLWPPVYQQHLPSHHPTLSAGEAFSSSLPNSLASSTLRPPSWQPLPSVVDGYSPQPMSRNSSSNSDVVVSHTLPFPAQTRRVPSTTATEPLPRLSTTTTTINNVPTDFQTGQLRRAEPWNSEQAARRNITSSPGSQQAVASEGIEMVRSGSGGIQFNGHMVEFGGLLPRPSQPAYPLEIVETEFVDENEEVMARRRRNTNSHASGYDRPTFSR
ncbi:hypothetical protein F66182_9202 [Fusarium sp. NRRL 66182]|nr:hypothetical protein F66182_9202 [Fusarium sp. NRRL 66182]